MADARLTRPKTAGLRLLSLDGGGIRGLSSLYILQQLMEQIDASNPPKPCDYFDMICGTSTGGLIAIMLGRLKMDVAACIVAYCRLSKAVFARTSNLPISWTGKVKARCSAKALEKAIKEIILQQNIEANAPLIDSSNPPCKIFVCAVRGETRNNTQLPSYASKRNANNKNITIWEAARATSAASGFFEPISIGSNGEQYLDGATVANNPLQELWSAACDAYPGPSLETRIQCMVSIGTGKPTLKAFGNSLFDVAKTLIAMATETEKTWQDFHRAHTEMWNAHQLFRFNVDGGLADVGLDEVAQMNTIVAATRDYLEDSAYTSLAACAHALEVHKEEVMISPTIRQFAPTEGEQDLLQCLGSIDLETIESYKDRNPKPCEGTCTWLFKHVKYQRWISAKKCRLLWISGHPGCGKSVLASRIIDYARTSRLKKLVCHFFFKDDSEKQRSIKSAIKALLYQILMAPGAEAVCKQIVIDAKRDGKTFAERLGTADECWKLLIKVITMYRHQPILCILDALDESEGSGKFIASKLASYFSQIEGQHGFMVLVTSRPLSSIETVMQPLSDIRIKVEDNLNAVNADILRVVAINVNRIANRWNLQQRTKKLLLSRIISKADKTFLWVRLILEEVHHAEEKGLLNGSEREFRDLLSHLPASLDELYQTLLNRSSDPGKARKLLGLIVVAARPLSLSELNTAVSIRGYDHGTKDIQLFPNLERSLKNICGSFLRVLDGHVYLVHQTAKEFLVRPPLFVSPVGKPWDENWGSKLSLSRISPWMELGAGIIRHVESYVFLAAQVSLIMAQKARSQRRWKHAINTVEAHSNMSEATLRYLLFPEFTNHPWSHNMAKDEQSVKNMSTRTRLLFQSIETLDRSEVYGNKEMGSDTSENEDEGSEDLEDSYMSFLRMMIVCREYTEKNEFLHYAATNWAYHFRKTGSKQSLLLPLVLSLCDHQSQSFLTWFYIHWIISRWRGDYVKPPAGFNALMVAALFDIPLLAKRLLEEGCDPNTTDEHRWTALHVAAQQGNLDVAVVLLQSKAEVNGRTNDGCTPIDLALDRGQAEVIQLLLNYDADILPDVRDTIIQQKSDLFDFRNVDLVNSLSGKWVGRYVYFDIFQHGNKRVDDGSTSFPLAVSLRKGNDSAKRVDVRGTGEDYPGNFTIVGYIQSTGEVLLCKSYTSSRKKWGWLYRGTLSWKQEPAKLVMSGTWGRAGETLGSFIFTIQRS